MGAIKDAIDYAARDYETDGVLASGLHEVKKADVRAIGPVVEAAIAAIAAAGLAEFKFDTKAAMDGDLAHPAGTTALVYDDPADANNDLWIKAGASGAGAWGLSGANGIIHDIISTLAQPYVDSAAGYANALAASISAVSQVVERKNVFVDPSFQHSAAIALKSDGTGSSGVWSGITSQTLTTSADGEDSLTVTNGTVRVSTLASRLGTTGDPFTFGLKINQRAYGAAGAMNIYIEQLDNAGAAIGGTLQYLKQNATSTSAVAETAWVSGILVVGAVNIRLTIQASGDAANKFEISLIDLHRGAKQAHRANINTIGMPDVYVSSPTHATNPGADNGRGSTASPFATLNRAREELRRANDRVLCGRIHFFAGDYTPSTFFLGDANGAAQSFAGHVEIVGLAEQRVRLMGGNLLAGITKTAGRANVYQAPLATGPTEINATAHNFPWMFEHETPEGLIAAAERRPLHLGETYRSPSTGLSKVADLATCDATPNSWYWSAGVMYFHPPTPDPTTNGKSYYVPFSDGSSSSQSMFTYAKPALGANRSGELVLSNIEMWYWAHAVKLDALAWFELNDVVAVGSGYNPFEFGSANGVANRIRSIRASQDGIGAYPGSAVLIPVPASYSPARVTLNDPYVFGPRDDAISNHILSNFIVNGGLLEEAGDAGLAPALGGSLKATGTRILRAGQILTNYLGAVVNEGEGATCRNGSTDAGGDQRGGTTLELDQVEIVDCPYGVRVAAFDKNVGVAKRVTTRSCDVAYSRAVPGAGSTTLILDRCEDQGSTTVIDASAGTGAPTILPATTLVT